jgi:riboflavin synthase
MFTGIVETLGTLTSVEQDQDNLHLTIKCVFTPELKVDQSVAHNGICLTVVGIEGDSYKVTAIAETLAKTTIGHWKPGNLLNLERGMKLGDRLDGHIVQGHVDQVGECTAIEDQAGSTLYTFIYDTSTTNVTIEKGSVTVNGVSLTVVNSAPGQFSVAIIPYTWEQTNFNSLKVGDKVNLEFDVIGKYVVRLYGGYKA